MEQKRIFVGTSKGLITVVGKETTWKIENIYFRGFPVSMIFIDPRDQNWWVALNHKHWGPKLHRSMDQGKSWKAVPVPSFGDLTNEQVSLKKVWVMEAADKNQPNTYWLGTEPAALFQSDGMSHKLVESLWYHPTRTKDKMWFGTGGDLPFLHSILVNPEDPDHVIVAVSSAGIFRSEDQGRTWEVSNTGLLAAYLPNPQASSGHDPHLILQSTQDPKIIWQQNHCGIYISRDYGKTWELVSSPEHHPHYGFCLAIDNSDPSKAWVIPAESDEERIAPNMNLSVYHSSNFGQSWRPLGKGLPSEPSFDIVLRNAFDRKDAVMAFGTNNGNLYVSDNDGENWSVVSNNLAKILYLKIEN